MLNRGAGEIVHKTSSPPSLVLITKTYPMEEDKPHRMMYRLLYPSEQNV